MITLGPNIIVDGVDSVGFNAVEISDNIIHPRDQERGLKIDDACTTELGNIGNNVFITETSNVLIDYGALTEESKDSYNTPNVLKYIVNSNAGISDSSISLRSNWTTLLTYTGTTLQTIRTNTNTDMKLQRVSNRIGVRMNVTTVLGTWKLGQIFQPLTGASAIIVHVETNNILYISDQNDIQFDTSSVIQGAFTTAANNPTIITDWINVEKEPRRVKVHCSVTAQVDAKDDDIELTMAYDKGL